MAEVMVYSDLKYILVLFLRNIVVQTLPPPLFEDPGGCGDVT